MSVAPLVPQGLPAVDHIPHRVTERYSGLQQSLVSVHAWPTPPGDADPLHAGPPITSPRGSGGRRRMTDPEDTHRPPALYHELLERQARLERLLEHLLDHDQRRERSARPRMPRRADELRRADEFPRRQVQILRLLVTGRTNRQIGARLQISPDTVRNHLTRIYRKLGVTTRTQAAVRARRARTGQRRSRMSMRTTLVLQ